MRRARVGSAEADGIVRARLGRPAQDVLEAVVVLEAWGGVPTADAFGASAEVLAARSEPDAPARRWTPPDPEGRESVVAEGIALLMAILAVAAWAGPLSRELGPAALERALQIALPLTLALQWTLRSRYLSRRAGLRCLLEDRNPLIFLATAIAIPLSLLPPFGPIAGVFVVIWVGGTLLARRGWGLGYGALVVGEAWALSAGIPARTSLVAVAGITTLAVLVAIATSEASLGEQPGRLGRALPAGLIGALLGGVLIGDTTLGWGVHGAFPALALVPSVVGSLWGGFHLWQFHAEIPRGLRGVPLAQAGGTIARGPAARIALGALWRLGSLTLLLSLAVLAAAHWTRGTDRPSLFVAFGCAALVCMFVSLHESLGYLRWALLSASAGLAVELAIQRIVLVPVPGVALIAGAGVGTAIALAPLIRRLRSPGRVLATALWIK